MIDNHFQGSQEDHHLAIVTQLELRQSNKEVATSNKRSIEELSWYSDDILKEGIEMVNLITHSIFDLQGKWFLVRLMKQLHPG